MHEQDAFEQTLGELFKEGQGPTPADNEQKKLKKVLKRANRQVGASALFSLFGRALEASVIALHSGSAHIRPVSAQSKTAAPHDPKTGTDAFIKPLETESTHEA